MEKLKVVITLAERARSRGRGLERFDGDCGIAQREEKRNWFIRICLVLVRNCNWKWNWKKEIVWTCFQPKIGEETCFSEYSNEKENFLNILFFNFVQDTF